MTRRYTELEGLLLVSQNPAVADDLFILEALQNIRFQLDEQGVRLKSESSIAMGCGKSSRPRDEPYVLVFDKPFLMLLQRSDAIAPYFALWVAHPEVLVKVVK